MNTLRHLIVASCAFALGSSFVLGCRQETTVPADPAENPARRIDTTDGVSTLEDPAVYASWKSYGEPVDPALPTVDLADVLADPSAYAGKAYQLTGTVTSVCQKKGCWLRIADTEVPEQDVFVKFTCPINDERLVPKDAVGKPALVSGEIVVEEMSEDEARHMAEDAGKSADEIATIVGPQKTIRIMSPAAKVGA